MKMFTFDPAEHRAAYAEQGYVHIREGITPEFHAYLLAYVEKELNAHLLDDYAIAGKKEQALFDFPDAEESQSELFDSISAMCGLVRERMVLSERHIQAYEPNADPEPHAHKDRYPSQVSVGLSITIPSESRLVLYPHDQREINPFSKAAEYNRYLQPEDKPENTLPAAREVELADTDRDVVIFPGSTTWHLRRRAARSVNVYFKMNDFGCDPLGEDLTTAAVSSATQAGLASPAVDALVPVVSRRLDTVARVFTRNDWQEVLQARVYGEEPVGVTELQFAVLRDLGAEVPLAEVAEKLAGPDRSAAEVRAAILRLAEIGAVDLLQA
jgi:hypothetical protein